MWNASGRCYQNWCEGGLAGRLKAVSLTQTSNGKVITFLAISNTSIQLTLN